MRTRFQNPDPHKEDQRSKRNLQPKCCANFSLHQPGEDGGWGKVEEEGGDDDGMDGGRRSRGKGKEQEF